MSGSKRQHLIIVLRSLFRHCKKTGVIFRDPTARMRAGKHPYRIVIPLQPHEISDTVTAATSPAARVAIALAGVHAARTKAITSLLLDDVDLGNRRLTLAGRVHPLDDLTRQILLD